MNLIKPLQLGNLQLTNNLIAGPLAGISCAAFRSICVEFGNPAFCCTEMLSAHNMEQKNQKPRYTEVFEQEKLTCFQISGNRPERIHSATLASIECGADLIDLNCGCPMKKIRQKSSGSKLLTETKLLADLIKAMRSATDKPISIKIRVGGDKQDSCHKEVADIAQSEGCDFITVHGRHWTDDYDTPARYEQIAEVASCLSIPVIGNGDIFDYTSLIKMAETGVDGFMISRGLIGNPWLTDELIAIDAGIAYEHPSTESVGKAFLRHIELLQRIEPDILVTLQSRRLASKYARSARLSNDFTQEVMQTKSLTQFKALISHYYGTGLPPAPAPAPAP